MNKLLPGENAAALNTIQTIIEQAPSMGSVALLTYVHDRERLAGTYAELPRQPGSLDPHYVADRSRQVIDIAEFQTQRLLHAAQAVIPRNALASADRVTTIGEVLHNSEDIGVEFGKVSSTLTHGEKSDDYILALIRTNPGLFLSYDDRQVTVNSQGRELLGEYTQPTGGCPALRLEVARSDGQNVNLFGLFWSGFTERYIQKLQHRTERRQAWRRRFRLPGAAVL